MGILETAPLSWSEQVAQDHLPDVVLWAGACKPNAPGRSSCSSLEAFGQRQVLKSAGLYRTERIIVAVTPLQIAALSVSHWNHVIDIQCWDRATTPVRVVAERGGTSDLGPAVRIGHLSRYTAIEVLALDPVVRAGMWCALGLGELDGTAGDR